MPIEIIESLPRGSLKKTYDAALDAAGKKNYDYAITLLRTVLKKKPGYLEARRKLREVEWERAGSKVNAVRQLWANVTAVPNMIKAPFLLGKEQYAEAMDNAEAVLVTDPTAPAGLQLLAKAAERAELTPVAIMALEWAVQHHPKNLQFLDWLANVYSDAKMGMKALEMRQKIASLQPDNRQAQDRMKQALAEAAMDDGGWNDLDGEKGGYQKIMRSSTDAAKLEQQERVSKDVDTARAHMEELEKGLAAGKGGINEWRKVAELASRVGEFDKSLEAYDHVVQLSGVLDPSTDEAITKIMTKQFDERIQEWADYAADEQITDEQRDDALQQVEELKEQRHGMLLERYEDRVKRYPNSVQDRFELGRLLFESARLDEALKHFQLVQKRPQLRGEATFYLGRCFAEKHQFDLAIDEFKHLIDDIKQMNQAKKDAYYFLGKCYEQADRQEEAAACYKTIYQADMSFRDVAQIMERLYQ